jgi:hypothetical protein
MTEPDLEPVPDSFNPTFHADRKKLIYRTVIQHRGPDGSYHEIKIEMGKRAPRSQEESNCFHAALRIEAWRVHELVRLGLFEKVRGFTKDRHQRPAELIKKPQISEELQAELETPPT